MINYQITFFYCFIISLAVKFHKTDSPLVVFILVWMVLAGIFLKNWTTGRYFWTTLQSLLRDRGRLTFLGQKF